MPTGQSTSAVPLAGRTSVALLGDTTGYMLSHNETNEKTSIIIYLKYTGTFPTPPSHGSPAHLASGSEDSQRLILLPSGRSGAKW